MSLIAELKRRNVIRTAGLYLVGAWLLVQVAGTILPMFGAADWIVRSIVIALAVAFLPAMIVAWVFELTPDGLKRDEDVKPEESIAPQTAQRMNQWLLVVSVVAIGYFAFDKFVLAPRRDAALVTQTKAHITAEISTEAAKVNPNSIAVLPFVNMSGDPNNEYFSDGISEEILNVLAQIPKLQVAARTSSFSFKGAGKEVPEIAKELKVRMVLEGSVRKQGERVRITAQLIDAGNGFHVWSQAYDRDLKDIFAIQDEIAKAIADELKVKLRETTALGKSSTGTRNLAAYDLYLRGMALWNTRKPNDLLQAIDLFQQATAEDPTFAQGYGGLALAYSVLPSYSNRMSWVDSLVFSNDFALRALALDPALPEAYAALAQVSLTEIRRETGIELAKRAVELRPSFATGHQWLGSALLSAGHLEAALAPSERASLLDPRSPVIADNHAFLLLALGRPAEARDLCLRLLETRPASPSCLQYAGFADLVLHDYQAARPLLERQAALQNPGASQQASALIDALEGRSDRRALAEKMARLPFNSLLDPDSGNALDDENVAALLVMLGERTKALDYMERIAGNLGNNMDWAIMLPQMDPIRCEARFIAIVKKLKTTDPRHAAVCGDTR
jgi:TolB-like protein